MFKDQPGFDIKLKAGAHYMEHMHQAHFCAAALGWGWSGRFKTATTRGCIPVRSSGQQPGQRGAVDRGVQNYPGFSVLLSHRDQLMLRTQSHFPPPHPHPGPRL